MGFETITKVVFAGQRSRGRGDDRAEVIQHRDDLVCVLADGAGGSSGGAEAADTVLLWAKAFCTRDDSDIRQGACWADLLAKIDRQLEFGNGETTAVIAAVWEGGIAGASVGDSAAWLIGPDGCDDLTAAQPYKPLLGRGGTKPVPFERSTAGGTLLLASDGLVKYAPRARICQTALLPNLTEAADALVSLVRLRSGALQDDVSVILCRPSTAPGKRYQDRKRYTLTEDGEMIEQGSEEQ